MSTTPVRTNHLTSFAEIMCEAAGVLRAMPDEMFDAMAVRHWLCDELEGSALMIGDAIRSAESSAQPVEQTPVSH